MQLKAREAADEQIALPPGQTVAGVEHHARQRDRRDPDGDGLLHSFAIPDRRDRVAGVLASKRHQRPTVVLAGLNQIELVAALRTLLSLPELTGCRMEAQALNVAMAVAVGLGLKSGASDKRLVH